MLDLWSADYYNQKAWQRVRDSKDTPFEPWEEARERYVQEKVEPLLSTYRQSDHDWFRDFRRRKGEVMHSSDLIFRLQRLNPHIQVQSQTNFPDDWGLAGESLGRFAPQFEFQRDPCPQKVWPSTCERHVHAQPQLISNSMITNNMRGV